MKEACVLILCFVALNPGLCANGMYVDIGEHFPPRFTLSLNVLTAIPRNVSPRWLYIKLAIKTNHHTCKMDSLMVSYMYKRYFNHIHPPHDLPLTSSEFPSSRRVSLELLLMITVSLYGNHLCGESMV